MEFNRIDTILDILDAAQNNQLHTLESETEIACIDFLLATGMLEQKFTQHNITAFGTEYLKRAIELNKILAN